MRRWLVVLIAFAALILFVGQAAARVAGDWLWFDSLGAMPVYRAQIGYQAVWRVAAGLAVFAFAFANLYALRRSVVSLVLPRRVGNLEIGEVVSARTLLAGVFVLAGVLAVVLSAPAADWTVMALARVAGRFNEMDPFLDRDLSYAVAKLPFELGMHAWAARVLFVMSAVIVGLYALTPSLRLRSGQFFISSYCRRHLAVLGALALVLLAWGWRLDGLSLTVAGPEPGAVYDAFAHSVWGPFLAWWSVLTGVMAFVVFWTAWHGQSRVAVLAAGLACTGGPLARATLPYMTNRTLSASERTKANAPYVHTRLLFSRRAFGVGEIDTAAATQDLPRSVAEAASGIPSWDPAALMRSVAGAPATRDSSAVAWPVDSAGIRAVVVAAVRGGRDEWTATVFDPMASGDDGRALQALPPLGTTGVPSKWKKVVAYPGAAGVMVVWDTTGRLPAPVFSGWARRLVLAWRVRAPTLLAEKEGDGPLPRLVFRRDVVERVHALVPFLTPGATVTPVLRGDTLYWSVDLFTTSSTYPLADPIFFSGTSRTYAHIAGTAFVHAATGRVLFVATGSPDAIMRAWMRRFPGLFMTQGRAPAALVAARPPSSDWAAIQATVFARTGCDAARADAQGSLATDNADAGVGDGPPSYFAARGRSTVLAWSVPVVDAGGMIAGTVVAVGGDRPRTIWVAGGGSGSWAELLDRMQQAADSASSRSASGAERRGRVAAVPTAAGTVFVQSHYRWPRDGPPVLAEVAGSVGSVVRAGRWRQAALGQPPPTAQAPGVRAAARELYRRMDEALRRGDWSAFGAAFEALGRLLRGSGP